MIHVIAHITAKPGKRAAILKLFRSNMPTVHAEEGCIEYQPVIDAEGFAAFATGLGDDGFMVVEKWASEQALKAHAASAHMAAYAAYAASSKDMIAERAVYVLSATS